MKSAIDRSSVTPDWVDGNFDGKYIPHKHMANVIIDITNRNGACEPKDLLALGFTRQETVDLWHMAHAMADVELRLMANKNHLKNNREIHYA